MTSTEQAVPTRLRLEALSPALGADVVGLDLAAVDDEVFATVHAALVRHQVLRFRAQALTPADLAAFSRRFGELDVAPPNENGSCHVPGHPEILVISNVVENGRQIGSLGAGEAVWHTDMSYLPTPPLASVLYAREVPETGGNTGFMDMYQPLADLPQGLRRRIEGRAIKHDATTNSAGYVRAGAETDVDLSRTAGHPHPIIARHPDTGRELLYLGRRHRAWVVGLPLAESEALLDELWGHVVHPRYAWSQRWQVGDVLMWDNRCTMHRRDAFDPAARRVMHRTQIRAS